MTAAKIAAKGAYGYAKLGKVLGQLHSQYRPITAGPALAPINLVGTLPFLASATADGGFRRPGNWTSPEYFALVDPSRLRAGDYLNGPTGTWFVASLETLTIPMVVQCDVIVTLSRNSGIAPGLNAEYGGDTAPDGTLLADWPASLIGGGVSESGRAALPSDPKRFGGGVCKLPAVPGVTIRSGDRIVVQNGDTFLVAAAFLQDRGWRLELSGAEA